MTQLLDQFISHQFNRIFLLQFNGSLKTDIVEQALNICSRKYNKIIYDSIDSEQQVDVANTALQVFQLDDENFKTNQAYLQNLTLPNQSIALHNPASFAQPLLFNLPQNRKVLLFAFHDHSTTQSMTSFLQEFIKLYIKIEHTKLLTVEHHAVSSKELRNKSNANTNTANTDAITLEPAKKAKMFWQDKLNELNIVNISPDYKEDNLKHSKKEISIPISPNVIACLEKLSIKYKISLENIFTAAVLTLLYKYTSEQDITVLQTTKKDIAISNANNAYINHKIPIRMNLDKIIPFVELAKKIERERTLALENELSLITIDDILSQQSETQTLLNTIACQFIGSKNSNTGPVDTSNFAFCDIDLTSNAHPITITLQVSEPEQAEIKFNYNANLYSEQTMVSIIQHFNKLFEDVAMNEHIAINDITMLTSEDEKLLLQYYDANIKPNNPTFIHEYITEIAHEYPERKAAVFHKEDGSVEYLTYAELDKQTDALAAYLINIGITPEKTVGVCLTRSLNLLIAIIAIFKAGGVVVTMENKVENPQDNNSPLLFKISDALINTILVDDETRNLFPADKEGPFCLNLSNNNFKQINKELGLKFTKQSIQPHNLAYIMYTSGTTGQPKGVMIEHQNLMNLIMAIRDRNLPDGSRVLCTAPATFDCSIWEILQVIATKGVGHFIHDNFRLSAITQQNIIKDYGINCATLLPNAIENLTPENLPSLYDVISMGSVPYNKTISRWQALGKSIRNEYGPTETTICTTEYVCIRGLPFTIIGKPIRNTCLYILKDNKICPPGMPGELYIGGLGVGRGYINEKLTAEKFIDVLFDKNNHQFFPLKTNTPANAGNYPSKILHKRKFNFFEVPIIDNETKSNHNNQLLTRLYATGDLASYFVLPDGTLAINFIGRKDRQIKIHGVRIEIDAVESTLRNFPNIKDVYIIPNSERNALIAYIIPKENCSITKDEIYTYLKNNHVIVVAWPKTLIELKSFPLTKNGKINAKALPPPGEGIITNINNAHSSLQNQLCQIWAKILHISVGEIDIKKTFLEHGGDSQALGNLELALNEKFKLTEKISINQLNPKKMTILSLESMINFQTHHSFSDLPLSRPNHLNMFGNNNPLGFQPLSMPSCNKSKNML